jgi:hypothetical protein
VLRGVYVTSTVRIAGPLFAERVASPSGGQRACLQLTALDQARQQRVQRVSLNPETAASSAAVAPGRSCAALGTARSNDDAHKTVETA